jgi:hypothetical protein
MTSEQLPLFRAAAAAGTLGNVRNLWRVMEDCRRWELELGVDYYWTQRQRLEAIGRREGFSLETVVGVFCAISPNNTEDGTYRGTVLILRNGTGAKVSSYNRNREKALLIRNGASPDSVLKGRKVTSFYRNTLDPLDASVLTIDGHMHSCWMGRRGRLTDAAHKLTDQVYTRVEADVRLLAGSLNLHAVYLQSTLWSRWRRLHGILTSDQLPLLPDLLLPENQL